MSEESLRRFLDRLNHDPKFREKVEKDPVGAVGEFNLTPAEQVALVSDDEDALRRLAGGTLPINAIGQQSLGGWLSRHICTWIFCGPPGTRDWQCRRQP